MDRFHRYIAASIPRHIRASRAPWLRRDAVIGCVKHPSGMVYDVVMLPAADFVRLRNRLAAQSVGLATLERGAMDAPYIPQDVKEMTVLPSESDPRLVAVRYFRNVFRLPDLPMRDDETIPYTPYTEL